MDTFWYAIITRPWDTVNTMLYQRYPTLLSTYAKTFWTVISLLPSIAKKKITDIIFLFHLNCGSLSIQSIALFTYLILESRPHLLDWQTLRFHMKNNFIRFHNMHEYTPSTQRNDLTVTVIHLFRLGLLLSLRTDLNDSALGVRSLADWLTWVLLTPSSNSLVISACLSKSACATRNSASACNNNNSIPWLKGERVIS